MRTSAGTLFLSALTVAASAQVPAGGEFRVNSYTTSSQQDPALAADRAGNVVVVWESVGQDGQPASLGIFGQRFDGAGLAQGAEFQVNTYTTGNQRFPAVAKAPDGRFVIVWTSLPGTGPIGIFGQRYDARGRPVGAEFQVNTGTSNDRRQPAVAMGSDGRFVVVWQADGQDGSGNGVFGRRYDGSGVALGGEFRANSYTTSEQRYGAVTMAPGGEFVVAWGSEPGQDGNGNGVFAQRYDASGTPSGAEFRVNTFTTSSQYFPSITADPLGNFMVVWNSSTQDGGVTGVYAQRYDALGAPRGAEFLVNTYTIGIQFVTSTAATTDSAGNVAVTWYSDGQDGSSFGVFGQRFDAAGARRGTEFRVNTYTTAMQYAPAAAFDANGNLVIAWNSFGQDGSIYGVFAQRFGGLLPATLDVDSFGNHVLEPGDTVDVRPSWRNTTGAAQTFSGSLGGFTGPAGANYGITDAVGDYGVVGDQVVAACTDCYGVSVSTPATRPVLHWDATLTENILPAIHGQQKRWLLHIGDSFSDVPRASGFYRFVETLLHHGVTGGCGATQYCPSSPTTREQMAVFVLIVREGAGYVPPLCGAPVFTDVPSSSPFCPWIEELARRGVVGGCGPGTYCPSSPVTREQMAVFVLRALDPALNPPACGTPIYNDVPASSPFCKWIEELTRRGVASGCGGGNYCPTLPVTREQMGVFLSVTFGLTLYGP